MLAALNDLEVKVGDFLNAYITTPITEKVWTVLGPEFGQDAGKSAVIVRALYGLKSACAAFRAHLASRERYTRGPSFWRGTGNVVTRVLVINPTSFDLLLINQIDLD